MVLVAVLVADKVADEVDDVDEVDWMDQVDGAVEVDVVEAAAEAEGEMGAAKVAREDAFERRTVALVDVSNATRMLELSPGQMFKKWQGSK